MVSISQMRRLRDLRLHSDKPKVTLLGTPALTTRSQSLGPQRSEGQQGSESQGRLVF